MLAALEPQLSVAKQHAVADADATVLELEDDAAAALRRLEREREAVTVALVAFDPLDLVEPLLPRLRLARAGAGAEAGDELLEPSDLGLLALDRAAERKLTLRLLGAPLMPGAGEELAAAGLEFEHRCRDRFEEPAVVRDQDHGRVERVEVRLEPLERGDVEVVGGLVEQQQVRAAGQRAAERGAGQLAAGERLEPAVEHRSRP